MADIYTDMYYPGKLAPWGAYIWFVDMEKAFDGVPWGVFCRRFGNMRYQDDWFVPSGPYTTIVKARFHSQ